MRRLGALIWGLPPGSATHRAVDPEAWQWGTAEGKWGTAEELLAVLVEIVDQGNRNFVIAHSEKGTQIGEPIRIPRPHKFGRDPDEPRRQSTPAEVRRFFHAGGAVKVDGISEGEDAVVTM